MALKLITPHWPAPANVRALVTTRQGGFSQAPYHSLNLGAHVQNNAADVEKNRQHLYEEAKLPNHPVWLDQTHSTSAVCIDELPGDLPHKADASYTFVANQICTILTADCLPLLVCNKQGSQVAAIHAGWRGLAEGIIENTLAHFECAPADLLVYLGPAIGPDSFEVGEEVLHQFSRYHPNAPEAFTAKENGKYLANLYLLASQRLYALGVENIYGGLCDTYAQKETFFSYRRDGETGRMASLIWFE